MGGHSLAVGDDTSGDAYITNDCVPLVMGVMYQ